MIHQNHKPGARHDQPELWESLLRPEFLFTVITIQALSPYAFWPLGIGRALSSSELTYIPAVILLTGWLSFLGGSWLVSQKLPSSIRYQLAPKANVVIRLAWSLVGVSIIEIVLAVKLYGVLPILSYLRNDQAIDVVTATELQERSFVGQIALLNISIALISVLLLEIAIIALQTKKAPPLVFYFAMVTALFCGLMNGKRIGSFRLFSCLICGLVLYDRNGIRNLAVLTPFRKSPIWSYVIVAGVASALLASFGPMAALRNQGLVKDVSTLEEIVVYQEGPIMNMEGQCKIAGYGPSKFSLLSPLQGMIPIKWLGNDVSSLNPPREDVSSPSGFYELVQWYWGMPGVIFMSTAVGVFCRWIYNHCRDSVAYLLCYSFMVFSILLSHSFNEFIIAPLVLVPCILFWVIGKLTDTRIVPTKTALGISSSLNGLTSK